MTRVTLIDSPGLSDTQGRQCSKTKFVHSGSSWVLTFKEQSCFEFRTSKRVLKGMTPALHA